MAEQLAYTIAEAAEASRRSRSTLYLEIAAGNLIARKHKGRTLILVEDLRAWLASLPTTKAAGGSNAAA